MRDLPPMFPPSHPTCAIQWIDCAGEPTPDENPAIGVAVIVHAHGERHAYPICRAHYDHMFSRFSHHDAECTHRRSVESAVCMVSAWSFEPYAAVAAAAE